MTEGQRLDKLRISLNKSWNAFAKMLGLAGPATLYLIRDGKREISPELMGRIEQMLKGNPEYIRSGEGEMFLKEDPVNYISLQKGSTELLCQEKERTIRLLLERIDEQKKAIEHLEKCVDMLKSGEAPGKKARSG